MDKNFQMCDETLGYDRSAISGPSIGGSRILVRGESRGNGSEGAPAEGCRRLAAPCRGPGVELLVSLGRSPRKFPKFAKFFIDFSLKIDLKFHTKNNKF